MEIDLRISRKIFNDAYYPYLFKYDKRYEIYYGGAGSGKSHFVFSKAVIKALNEKRKYLVVRKTAKSNANSTFQMLLDTLSQFNILSMCNVNRTTLTVKLPNESVFLFYGCDDVEKIKSIAGITDIICEEATELSIDDVSQLDLRLRAKADNLTMTFMFNPVSKANWVYKKWFAEDAVIDEDTTRIIHTTYLDNRFLPPEYIEMMEKMCQTNPTHYRIYALGEFASLDKLVFNNWRIEEFDNAKTAGELLCGLDFGYVNDITAFTASLLDEANKRIYIFKEWGSTGKTNEEIAGIISSLGFSKSTIIADSAEMKSIEEIKRKGIQRIKPATKGKDSILHGIQKLQQYEIIIHPSCTGVITEFENYSWKRDKFSGEYINTPIDDFNHYIDSIRYSMQCIDNSRKIQTFSKSALSL